MPKSRSFGSVNAATWACIKLSSEKEHDSKYLPAGANVGTATTPTPIGDVILGFNYDPEKDTVSYTIEKKPFIVTSNQIWNGLQETIDHCNAK